MGPCECDCPEPVLDLLTTTDREYALQWRPDAAKTSPPPREGRQAEPTRGTDVVFDAPLSFADGRSFQRLEVIANPRSHRTVLFARLAPAASTGFPTSRVVLPLVDPLVTGVFIRSASKGSGA